MNDSGTSTALAPSASEMGDQDAPVVKENKEINGKVQATQQQQPQPVLPSEEMIKIKRTYKFAGELITEEKLVPKDSAEAKLFLMEANGETAATTEVEDADSKRPALNLRRPLRKTSRFDPNPIGLIKKNWEKQLVDPSAANDNKEATGPKLNTVEKSKLDWATYVDQAGIKDELNLHSRAKDGYLGRMDFLGRVEAKREEERRNVRLKQV
jgi:Bucentaur or craniofacial development